MFPAEGFSAILEIADIIAVPYDTQGVAFIKTNTYGSAISDSRSRLTGRSSSHTGGRQ